MFSVCLSVHKGREIPPSPPLGDTHSPVHGPVPGLVLGVPGHDRDTTHPHTG